MTIANESTMRRIAIVLASLPEPVAQRLLGSLHADSQRSIRAALGSLVDVDPLERRRALDGFANSLRKDSAHGKKNDDAVEIVFSRTAIRNLKDQSEGQSSIDAAGGSAPVTKKGTAPLAFLLDVDDEAMVEHLSGEMPQTLAIILASISPAQAARVLPRLDVKVRAEAMRRMANLKELPSELIDDIGNQLRRRLVPARGTNGAGRVALDAILAEMPQEYSQPESPQRPVAIESSMRAAGTSPSSTAAKAYIAAEASSEANASSAATSPAVKLAEGTWPENGQGVLRTSIPQTDELHERSSASSQLLSSDGIHSYLLSLPVDRLREALGKVAIRTALLTLCGLPKNKAEAVLASLPRRQAKQVRDQISQLGTLELRDIDEAKEAVATLLLGQRAVDLSIGSNSRLAAAA